MAEEKPKDSPKAPPLPGLPPMPGAAARPPQQPAMGPLPGMPPLPGLPPMPRATPGTPGTEGQGVLPSPRPQPSFAAPPSAPAFSMPGFPPMSYGASPMPPLQPAAPPSAPAQPSPSAEMEKKVAELEKRLQEEREKVLLANLKSQEEANYASKVEAAIKDVQDKLRRDRREAEMEESRLKLEGRIHELEQRLVQERETWVSTLKGQVKTRESQDKELETHFSMKMQELERRFLDEKAQWQKTILTKEEENRNLRSLAEKLKGIEFELHKATQEKKYADEKILSLSQEVAAAQARIKVMEEHEREFFQVKAEWMSAKEQVRALQDKIQHEVEAVRLAAKEREERLLADQERLQRDVREQQERLRREQEKGQLEVQAAVERAKHESEVEINKHRAEANMATAALQRLKAVAGALERQTSTLKAQADEAVKAKKEVERVNQHYKSEFLILQKRWQEREKEIRKEVETIAQQTLEVERIKLKLQGQDELQSRLSRMREEFEQEWAQRIAQRQKQMNEPPAPPAGGLL